MHQVLRIPPDDFDAEGAAALIEEAIRNATRERESKARRRLRGVQAAAQERLAQLLSSSPSAPERNLVFCVAIRRKVDVDAELKLENDLAVDRNEPLVLRLQVRRRLPEP